MLGRTLGQWSHNSSRSEVNLAVSHHKIMSGTPLALEALKPIVFILDDVKSEQGGKKGKNQKETNFKTFGSFICVDSFKKGSKMALGWRCRRISVSTILFTFCFGSLQSTCLQGCKPMLQGAES